MAPAGQGPANHGVWPAKENHFQVDIVWVYLLMDALARCSTALLGSRRPVEDNRDGDASYIIIADGLGCCTEVVNQDRSHRRGRENPDVSARCRPTADDPAPCR